MFPEEFTPISDSTALPPPPSQRNFVLTTANGKCLYGVAISFYEIVESPQKGIYGAKSICLLSQWAFFESFLLYLEELLFLARDENFCPGKIEKCLCNLFHEIPLPPRGRTCVQMTVGLCDIMIYRPPIDEFPILLDEGCIFKLFATLSSANIIKIFFHVLLEHKILLVSKEPLMLTAVAESIRALIFPLHWQYAYIPIVPGQLDIRHLMEAPIPFIAGVLRSQLGKVSHQHQFAHYVRMP